MVLKPKSQDHLKRWITGLAALPVLIGSVLAGGIPFTLLVAFGTLTSLWEYCGLGALGAGMAAIVILDLQELKALAQEVGVSTRPAGAALRWYDWTKHQYVYLVDLRKCIGCGACVRACARENDVPEGYFRTWVERYRVSATGEIVIDSPKGGKYGFEPSVIGYDVTKGFFFPKLCCHCTNTPCVQLCPVGASYRTLDGVVLVDESRCVGCGYCVQACPYGSRFLHPVTHTASYKLTPFVVVHLTLPH